MIANLVSLHRLPGIRALPDGDDVPLLRTGVETARLTSRPGEDLDHLHRVAALGAIWLAGLTGTAGGDVVDRYRRALDERILADPGGTLLVARVTGDVGGIDPAHVAILPGAGVGLSFATPGCAALKERLDRNLDAAFAAVASNLEGDVGDDVRRLGDALWFQDPATAAPVYLLRVESRLRATVATTLSRLQAARMVHAAPTMLDDASLASVHRLLRRSSAASDDDLEAFTAAWTGLEILLNKLAASSGAIAGRRPTSTAAAPTSAPAGAERLDVRTKLEAVLAAGGMPDAAGVLAEFMAIKRIRNTFYHAGGGSDRLPAERTRRLLRRILSSSSLDERGRPSAARERNG